MKSIDIARIKYMIEEFRKEKSAGQSAFPFQVCKQNVFILLMLPRVYLLSCEKVTSPQNVRSFLHEKDERFFMSYEVRSFAYHYNEHNHKWAR